MGKVVVLLSGGVDSSVLLYDMNRVEECCALTVSYGQRHFREIEAAKQVAAAANVPWQVLVIPWCFVGKSPLVDAAEKVPDKSEGKQASTVVPLRNTMFLTVAAGWAQAVGAEYVCIGAVVEDYENYPDCRPRYFTAISKALSLSGEIIGVRAPYVDLSKESVVDKGTDLGVPFGLTYTCYRGKELACGVCDACVERLASFKANGLVDPIKYEEGYEKT